MHTRIFRQLHLQCFVCIKSRRSDSHLSHLPIEEYSMAGAIDLSKIPPEQLAQMPAGVPPPGVTPDLVNPPNVGNYIIVANSVLMLIMFMFVALRFYVIFKIKKKMGADDWTVVAALIGSCYYFVVVCLGEYSAQRDAKLD